MTIRRRYVLKALAASLGSAGAWPYLSDSAVATFAAIQSTNAPPRLVFLTPAQYATVDAVTETILPSDDHSPGARAARVADYIDLLLSESDETTRKRWIDGVAALDKESRRRFQMVYADLSSDKATELLTAISRNEFNPKNNLERFFAMTKAAAIRGHYTSEIGIHKELEYKGNQYLSEFVGCTHPEHGYVEGK
ncbi:MAG: gluconate 2-dehydrogenase subunit 3 family protein [Vicinamibacterales bacterium]